MESVKRIQLGSNLTHNQLEEICTRIGIIHYGTKAKVLENIRMKIKGISGLKN